MNGCQRLQIKHLAVRPELRRRAPKEFSHSLTYRRSTAARCLLSGRNPSTLLRKGCASHFLSSAPAQSGLNNLNRRREEFSYVTSPGVTPEQSNSLCRFIPLVERFGPVERPERPLPRADVVGRHWRRMAVALPGRQLDDGKP